MISRWGSNFGQVILRSEKIRDFLPWSILGSVRFLNPGFMRVFFAVGGFFLFPFTCFNSDVEECTQKIFFHFNVTHVKGNKTNLSQTVKILPITIESYAFDLENRIYWGKHQFHRLFDKSLKHTTNEIPAIMETFSKIANVLIGQCRFFCTPWGCSWWD